MWAEGSNSFYDIVSGFDYVIRGVCASQGGEGVGGGIFSDDCAGVDDRTAADICAVAKYSAELTKSRFVIRPSMNDDVLTVILEVRADRSGAEVGVISEDTIADVIIMWDLHAVKEDAIFQLTGIADDAIPSGYHAATEERPGAYLRALTDDAGRLDGGIRIDPHALADEDALGDEGIAIHSALAEALCEAFYFRKHFPRIFAG